MVIKFLWFRSIHKIFGTVTIRIWMRAWHLVYYQVSGEPESLTVVIDQTFTSGSVDLHASLFVDHCHVILFFVC